MENPLILLLATGEIKRKNEEGTRKKRPKKGKYKSLSRNSLYFCFFILFCFN
jgi:hypothetical protein